MVIYRPHRGGLAEAMEEAREFSNLEEMKQYIVKYHEDMERGRPFELEDIVIGDILGDDPRIGWNDCRYVCVKRYFNEEYIIPQAIGHCSEDYTGWISTEAIEPPENVPILATVRYSNGNTVVYPTQVLRKTEKSTVRQESYSTYRYWMDDGTACGWIRLTGCKVTHWKPWPSPAI